MSSAIVQKVWSFCNTLRDDGVGYGEYLEQLTYLLFLKMADEYSKPPHNKKLPIPATYNCRLPNFRTVLNYSFLHKGRVFSRGGMPPREIFWRTTPAAVFSNYHEVCNDYSHVATPQRWI